MRLKEQIRDFNKLREDEKWFDTSVWKHYRGLKEIQNLLDKQNSRGVANTESAYWEGGEIKYNPGEIIEGSYVKHLGQTGCRSHIKWKLLSINHKKKKVVLSPRKNIEQTIWKEWRPLEWILLICLFSFWQLVWQPDRWIHLFCLFTLNISCQLICFSHLHKVLDRLSAQRTKS